MLLQSVVSQIKRHLLWTFFMTNFKMLKYSFQDLLWSFLVYSKFHADKSLQINSQVNTNTEEGKFMCDSKFMGYFTSFYIIWFTKLKHILPFHKRNENCKGKPGENRRLEGFRWDPMLKLKINVDFVNSIVWRCSL